MMALPCVHRPTLSIRGQSKPFEIARVFGIGRNYSEHPDSEPKVESDVVIFMKDAFMVSPAAGMLRYPTGTDLATFF